MIQTKKAKTEQLQIRVSSDQKEAIKGLAQRAGLDVSAYVLGKLLSSKREEFQSLLKELKDSSDKSYPFASINDFLSTLDRGEFELALSEPPDSTLDRESANYLAAMVEHAAYQKGVAIPDWTQDIEPLKEPFFGSELKKLRLGLLLNSPLAFRKRNIFVDSTIGDRV